MLIILVYYYIFSNKNIMIKTIEKECKHHWKTIYSLRKGWTYRCRKCDVDAVNTRRRI